MFLNPILYDAEEAERIMNHLNNPDIYLRSLDEYQKMQQLVFLNEQLTALLEMDDPGTLQLLLDNPLPDTV